MKLNLKVVIGIVAALLLVTAILTSNNSARSELKIGVIAPLSGLVTGGSNLGQNFANGVILAHEQYQSSAKNPLVLIDVQDDGFESKKGVSAYRKLMDVDKVNALINLSSPTIDVIASDVIKQKNMPVIQLGSQANPQDDNIFELYPNQHAAVNTLAELINNAGHQKIIVASQQAEAYAKWVDGFERAHKGQTINEKIDPSNTDFRPMALKISQHRPDAIVIFMGSKEGAQLIKRLRELNYELPPLYFDIGLQLGLVDYKNILGSLNSLEGATGLVVKNLVTDTFKQEYLARFGSEPGPLAEYGYDSFNVLMSTYDQNPSQWIKNLESIRYDGASGHAQFDSLGLRLPEFDIVKVKEGKIVVQ